MRDSLFHGDDRPHAVALENCLEIVSFVRQKHADATAKDAPDMHRRCDAHRVDALGSRQVPAEVVEYGRSPLALACGLRLFANALREATDDQRDQEHHPERDQVANVADRQAVVGRNEEEVIDEHARYGCDEQRTVAESLRKDDDPKQEDHDNFGELRSSKDESGEHRGERHHPDCLCVASSFAHHDARF